MRILRPPFTATPPRSTGLPTRTRFPVEAAPGAMRRSRFRQPAPMLSFGVPQSDRDGTSLA